MNKKILFYLLIILAIAAFFRLWNLGSIPPGLYPDEAINGNEAITNPGQLFYQENNGREGLFINLLSLSFSIFGISLWSLKFISAIAGILTVLGIYLLTQELLTQCNEARSRYVGLFASFFLAVSFWHTNFSRIAFRAILIPFILVFGFYFLFRGFRLKRFSFMIISGLFLGLGFHTYIPYRFVVLLLLFVLVNFWLIYKEQNLQKKFLFSTFYFLLATFLVALPIGIYFLQNPQDFFGRATPISIFAAESPIKEFGKSLLLHLTMFNVYGDGNWRHNFAGSPQLFWPIGIFFLIGLFLSLRKLISSLQKKDRSLFTVHCLLLSWLFIMLLPGILTYEGIPHSLRVIGAIPVVYIFAALGGHYSYNWLSSKAKNKKLFIVLCSLFIVLLLLAQFYKYFFSWGQNPEVANAFSRDYVQIGNYLNSVGQDIQKYVIVNRGGVPIPWPDGIPMSAQTSMFIERTRFGKIRFTYLLPENLNDIKINERKTIILPLGFDENLFNELKTRFPEGKVENKNGVNFYTINF